MKKLVIFAMGVMTVFPVISSAAAPAKEAICQTCHGPGGGKPIMDTYPKINGQNKGYLIAAIKAYKNGDRKGGMSAVMAAQSASLSDKEIEELATYYSGQK